MDIEGMKSSPARTDVSGRRRLDARSLHGVIPALVHPNRSAHAPEHRALTESTTSMELESPALLKDIVKKSTYDQKVAKKGSAQKSFTWAWLTVFALLLVIGGLVTGYVVVVTAADSAASSYRGNMSLYVDDVYDAAVSSSASPADIVASINAINKPVLDEALLGETFSSDYASAVALGKTSDANLDLLTKELGTYSEVYEFYSAYQAANAKVFTISESVSATSSKVEITTAFSNIETQFVSLQKLVDTSVLPNELDDSKVDLALARQNIVTSWRNVIAARNTGSVSAYTEAYASYSKAARTAEEAFAPIASYNSGLSLRFHSIAGDFKAATK
jgi:hypothetical protein